MRFLSFTNPSGPIVGTRDIKPHPLLRRRDSTKHYRDDPEAAKLVDNLPPKPAHVEREV